MLNLPADTYGNVYIRRNRMASLAYLHLASINPASTAAREPATTAPMRSAHWRICATVSCFFTPRPIPTITLLSLRDSPPMVSSISLSKRTRPSGTNDDKSCAMTSAF